MTTIDITSTPALTEEARLRAAIAAGPGQKNPNEFKWTLPGGFVVGYFHGDGLGARAPDGGKIHVTDHEIREWLTLAGHPALGAADAMDATDRHARWCAGKELEYIMRG